METQELLEIPEFIVKCVSYPGNDIHVSEYLDSQDISGLLKDVFDQSVSFIQRHLKRIQKDKNVNSLGEPEIPRIVLEEIVANALIHRDFFISAPIRIFIFSDRIEIISPGHLPNNLTIENIKKTVTQTFEIPFLHRLRQNSFHTEAWGMAFAGLLKPIRTLTLLMTMKAICLHASYTVVFDVSTLFHRKMKLRHLCCETPTTPLDHSERRPLDRFRS